MFKNSTSNSKIEIPPSSSDIKRRQKRNLMLLGVAFLALIALSTWLGSHDNKKTDSASSSPVFKTIALGTDAVDNHSLWLHRAENLIHQQQKEIETLKENLVTLNEQKNALLKTDETLQSKVSTLEQKTESLQKTLEQQKGAAQFGVPLQPVGTDGKPLKLLPGVKQDPLLLSPPRFAQGIKNDEWVLSNNAEHSFTTSSSLKTSDAYVPAGTFVKAVLLSGLDASAGVTSQTEPRPVVLRITEEGTLPNHLHSHLKDCMVTASGFGDISSERVYIRLERISCAKEKDILDIPVFGYVSGPDGKAGVRGIVVWRENALLQRSFISGLFSGLSQGVANTYTQTSFTPLGNTSSIASGDILKSGVTTGASTALGKLADYNIKRAEQYQPVIQMSATTVTIVFHTGFFLAPSHEPGTPASISSEALPTPMNSPLTTQQENTHENP